MQFFGVFWGDIGVILVQLFEGRAGGRVLEQSVCVERS